jgi:hypothetical protein
VAAGQNADDYRGGWRTDSGEAHSYELSIRGARVRGVYCADATTLAFVDGTFGREGITFEVTHVNADGSTAYKDKAIAKFTQGHRACGLERDAVHDVRRPPAATTSPAGGPCPGVLAAGSDSDRGHIRQRLARMASEKHIVAPLTFPCPSGSPRTLR